MIIDGDIDPPESAPEANVVPPSRSRGRYRPMRWAAVAVCVAVAVGCSNDAEEDSFSSTDDGSTTSTSAEPTTTQTDESTSTTVVESTTTTVVDEGSPGQAAAVDWQTTAADQARGERGSFSVTCPPGGEPASVWGTEFYTADSSVCTAAVHAGAITLADGGVVTFSMEAGQSRYEGSEANGVTTGSWGPFRASFRIQS